MRTSLLFPVLLLLIGCDRESRLPPRDDPSGVSDRSREPGTNPQPTTDASLHLLEDPNDRRMTFHSILSGTGKPCALVTEAVLLDGFEGTDVWRVTCSDSGNWRVTFRTDAPTTIDRDK